MARIVTERDLRAPEFRNGDPSDYEFRGDGKIVRKDRWKMAIGQIADLFGIGTRTEWEISDVVSAVRNMATDHLERANNIIHILATRLMEDNASLDCGYEFPEGYTVEETQEDLNDARATAHWIVWATQAYYGADACLTGNASPTSPAP